MDTTNWKTQLKAIISEELNSGDKVILPPNVLEDLLNQFNHTLPTPLTFKLSTTKGKYLHCGVREFSGSNDTVIIPKWIYEYFKEGDSSIETLILESVELPKGEWAKLVPLDEDFLVVKDLRVMFETSLRANFTALTQGQILYASYASKDYLFKVEKLKPASAINIIDTDLEIDIQTPTNFIQGSSNLSSINQNKSNIREIKLDTVIKSKLDQNNTLYFQFLWSKTTSFEVHLNSLNQPGPNLFLIPGITEPSFDLHYWACYNSLKSKSLIVDNKDSEFKSPYHYTLAIQTEIDCEFELIVKEHFEATHITDDKIPNENEALCESCQRLIPKNNFQLHTNFCLRNNIICKICNQVFKSNEINNHWHCEICKMVANSIDKESHNKFYHQLINCECGISIEGYHNLSKHKIIDCSNRLIKCRYCHDLVPYNKKSQDPADWELNLTEHESYCGNRTITCSKCNKHVSLKKVILHAKYHDFIKQNQSLPFKKCSNVNCPKEQDKEPNELNLCQACFSPLYSPIYDPDLKLLRKRVALRYHTQLTKGCQKIWCNNEYCATRSKQALSPNDAAVKLIPLLTVPLPKNKFTYFCVNQTTNHTMSLANKLLKENNNIYQLEWCIKALTKCDMNFNDALSWLRVNAPTIKS